MAHAPLLVYVRQSKTDGKEDGRNLSPSQQEARARSLAESRGYTVGEVYSDIDVSGGTHPRDRPGMAAALEEVRAGRAGGLVAFALDRFSRDPGHGEWLVKEVTDHGGVLLAPDIPEDITSSSGELTFTMLLAIARMYRRSAGERFKLSVEQAIARGIPIGRVPYGYRRVSERTGNRDDRHLETDPEAAAIVRELFERRVRGDGFGVLCDWMMEVTGRTWSRAGVSDLVDNDLYKLGRVRSGEFVSPIECGVIVEPELWAAAQRPRVVKDGRSSAPNPTRNPRKSPWLLSGLAKCAGCGNNLHPWGGANERNGRRGERRYRCAKRACQARASIIAPALEVAAIDRAFKLDLEYAETAKSVDLSALEDARDVALRRFEAMQAPDAADAFGDAFIPTVKARREELEAAETALGHARSGAGVGLGRKWKLMDIWEELDGFQARDALQHIFESIVVAKVPPRSEPEIEWNVRVRPWRTEFQFIEFDWQPPAE